MFIESMWLAGRPSRGERRLLTGRTEDYPDWVFLLVCFMSSISTVALFLAGGVRHASAGPGERLSSSIYVALGIAVIFAAVTWLGRPRRRAQYRNGLIHEGKLLTRDDPAGQLVLFSEAFGCRDEAAMADFASTMADGRRRFNDEYWYLDAGVEQQALWQELVSRDSESILTRLRRACECPELLLEHLESVLTEQKARRDAGFKAGRDFLEQMLEKYTAKVELLKRSIAQDERQLDYDPAWHVNADLSSED